MTIPESDEDLFLKPTHQAYVSTENKYMLIAKDFAREHSLDKVMPTCSVIVKEGKIIGIAANGSSYHDTHVCERVRLHIPTGQGYELCEGCHYKNHSETRAIADALSKGFDVNGAELYLWGHWWLCRWCREAIAKAGITYVNILEKAEILFNKNKDGNIVGKQFNA